MLHQTSIKKREEEKEKEKEREYIYYQLSYNVENLLSTLTITSKYFQLLVLFWMTMYEGVVQKIRKSPLGVIFLMFFEKGRFFLERRYI